MTLYKHTPESIEKELKRFRTAQALIAIGELEEARRLWWWPKNEEPPKQHWSQAK